MIAGTVLLSRSGPPNSSGRRSAANPAPAMPRRSDDCDIHPDHRPCRPAECVLRDLKACAQILAGQASFPTVWPKWECGFPDAAESRALTNVITSHIDLLTTTDGKPRGTPHDRSLPDISRPDAGLQQPSGRPSPERRVKAGSLTAVVGANGSGKSTLMKGIVGVLKPMAGPARSRDGARIAYLPQQSELDRVVSGPRRRSRLDGPVAEARAARPLRPAGPRRGCARR